MPKPQPSEPSRRDDVLLITRYCDGQLSAVEFDQFNDRLAVDPALRRLLIELVIQSEHLETVVTRPEAVFDEYAYIPPAAQVEKVSARSVAKTGAFLIREALHSPAVQRATALAAAVVLLVAGLVLALTFGGGAEPVAPYSPSAGALPKTTPAAAVLTGKQDARWDSADLKTGDALFAGQRYILLEGFAQITTARGAVALLEGPCTIELLDRPNALRLHAGKLVGICETDASQGFIVRTPHLDVTDLGTRFGVDADAEASVVQVFEGVVHARPTRAPADAAPMSLTADQSARAAAAGGPLERVAPDARRFATLQPASIPLPGTGQGLALNQRDADWRVITEGNVPLDRPGVMFVVNPLTYEEAHDPSADPHGPQWLQYHPALEPTAQRPSVIHLIQSGFNLDPELDPQTTRLVIACGGDNILKAIHVNGHRVTALGEPRGRMYYLTIEQHLRPGSNTVLFEVENIWTAPGRNPIGLYVRWHLLPAASGVGPRANAGP